MAGNGTPDWMRYISLALSQGQLDLARDQFNQITLPTFTDITKPTSYANLTGFLPGDYRGPYAGGPAWSTMADAANMFGQAGNDPRWAAMGYQNGQQTLGGQSADISRAGLMGRTGGQMGQYGFQPGSMTLPGQQYVGDVAARDTQLAMQYGGGTYVAGSIAPPWMQPFADLARQFASQNMGRQPNQQELTNLVDTTVNSSMEQLRSNPEYQQADRARKVQMEAEAVSGSIGMDPQNAANFITELRQGTDQGKGPSSPQDIMQAAARWMAPSDPAANINNAMNQLRNNPQYQQADGATKRQMEAQAIQQVLPNSTPDQATQIVNELRSGSAASNTLSSNDRINQVVSKVTGNQPPQVYGQGTNQLGPPGTTAPAVAGTSAGTSGTGGSINYSGSGQTGSDSSKPMSPEQRALNERGREFDVGAQLSQRSQDIDKQLKETDQRLLSERQAQQKAIEDGNLDLARQHETNITNLEQQKIDISKSGQDADIALRAADTMGVKSATDVFQSIGRARSLAPTSVADTFNKFQGDRGRPGMDQFTNMNGGPGMMPDNARNMLMPPNPNLRNMHARPMPESSGPDMMSGRDMQFQQQAAGAADSVLESMPGMNTPDMQQARMRTMPMGMGGNRLRPPDQFGMRGHAAPTQGINPVEGSVSASMGIGLKSPTQMRTSDFDRLTSDEQGMLESAFMDQTKSSQGVMGQLMKQGNPTRLGSAPRARMRM